VHADPDTPARRAPHAQRAQPHTAADADLTAHSARAIDAAGRRSGGPRITDAAAGGEDGDHCSEFGEAQQVDRRHPPSTGSADAK
jgi:hypothetical protein